MRELVGRLEALDPDAGAALRVVTYFDELVERRAGLENVVRGAAVLSGSAAQLVDLDRGVRIRVVADGTRTEVSDPPDPHWCHLSVDSRLTVWIERPSPAGPVEAVVLERAMMAARTVLDRTRSRISPRRGHDPELIEVLLDAAVPEADRAHAARVLGLSAARRARVVALVGGGLDVVPEPLAGTAVVDEGDVVRAGVGPAVAVLDLPASAALAVAAARFTAEGTAEDPGPRVVRAEQLGGLLLLADAVDRNHAPVADVAALERAAGAAPWMLQTLDVFAGAVSLRAAAALLAVHHSTLQDRLASAERVLGWSLRDATGLMRLNAALMIRRLVRTAAAG